MIGYYEATCLYRHAHVRRRRLLRERRVNVAHYVAAIRALKRFGAWGWSRDLERIVLRAIA